MRKILLAFVSLSVAVGLAEFSLRLLLKDKLAYVEDERNLAYRHDALLGWFPVPNSTREFHASRTIRVRHNSRGFRDDEHTGGDEPGILFLGDSFTWGFDVEEEERFTELLQADLPGWQIHNLGVSGYGTDQEYLILRREFDFYRPKIVFVVYASNDIRDNCFSTRYGGYAKPHFVRNGDRIELAGVPVPKGLNHYFAEHSVIRKSYVARAAVRAWYAATFPETVQVEEPTRDLLLMMRDFLEERGAELAVAMETPRPDLERWMESRGIPWVEVGTDLQFENHGKHWTPAGHRVVRDKLLAFLHSPPADRPDLLVDYPGK